jgi:hypothetical protein
MSTFKQRPVNAKVSAAIVELTAALNNVNVNCSGGADFWLQKIY